MLALRTRTIAEWNRRRCRVGADLLLRGRPASRATDDEALDVIAFCFETGGVASIPRLAREFPGLARRELASLAAQYAAANTDSCRRFCLRWERPRSVWAMDFTEAPLEGEFRYVLSVRDLASGRQLVAMPTSAMDAETTQPVLEALFAEHGPPLVMKCDNGSAFIAREMENFLRDHRVQVLLSPVRRPEYNGSCEAGIGALKARAHRLAALNGRPSRWSCDDVESARLLGNSAPQGLGRPSADDRWRATAPLAVTEREVFEDALARRREKHPTLSERAITRFAMEDVGLVSIRRSRITPPIRPHFRTKIS